MQIPGDREREKEREREREGEGGYQRAISSDETEEVAGHVRSIGSCLKPKETKHGG